MSNDYYSFRRDTVGVVMADGRGGGQGAYTPPVTVIALALVLAQLRLAPVVPPQPRFDVDAGLLGPMPRKSNISSAIQPWVSNIYEIVLLSALAVVA